MIDLCPQVDCTGCMACLQKCKNEAIQMQVINGFWYPFIDSSKCIECGACESVCPILNKSQANGVKHQTGEICFAAWNKNEEERMSSSSGGVFSIFAKKILNSDGVVYGAAWGKDLHLSHRCIRSIEDLDLLRRSKYVQSDTLNTYNEVKEHLKEGRKVLYCGTPCQIAGIKTFLGKQMQPNLFCIDVLCQGVPSPYLFRKYIDEVEMAYGGMVDDCNFRTKKYGWRCGLLLLLTFRRFGRKQRDIEMMFEKNAFYNSFIKEYFMRPSCYDCKFKNQTQGYYGDITIADFWRIGNKIPLNAPDYEKGISAILLNTKKGHDLFSSCSEEMEIIERTWDEFATNGGLRNSKRPPNNKEALLYLQSHTWQDTQKKYFPVTWRSKVKIIMNLTLGERVSMKIKKLVRML